MLNPQTAEQARQSTNVDREQLAEQTKIQVNVEAVALKRLETKTAAFHMYRLNMYTRKLYHH